MGETSVIVVRPQTTKKHVMIEAIAIAIGTSARNEPNTNARTNSAPTPPSNASTSTPGPLPPPLWFANASKPVRWTGAPATVAPASALLARLAASGLSSKACLGSGGGYATTNVVCLSAERQVGLAGLAYHPPALPRT